MFIWWRRRRSRGDRSFVFSAAPAVGRPDWEICPLVAEYPILEGENPVLLVQDGCGVYDEGLNGGLCAAGVRAGVEVQLVAIIGFASDASIAMKFGHVAHAACLGFPTQNTPGFEIAHRAGERQLRSYPQSLL